MNNNYDILFKHQVPNSMDGIIIFGKDDDYLKPQLYNKITDLENEIWADLYSNVSELQKKYGVNINTGAIRYSDSELRFKVTARKGKVVPKLTKEAFQVGDKVKINHKSANGKEWLVEKIMSKNIRVSEIGGFGMVRVSPSLLEKL